MKRHILKLYYKLLNLKDLIIIFYNKKIISKRKAPNILNTDITLDKIVKDGCSVSRFGDGEFALMNGKNLIFQTCSDEISYKLREVIKSNNHNHIVCIPDVFDELNKFNNRPKIYWQKYLNLNRGKIYSLLDKNKIYYDALVTRLYIDYRDKTNVKSRFDKLKNLWDKRNLIIVEGEKSRLGIGNDLFVNSNSIKRIICPSKNAFLKYNGILEEVRKCKKDNLVLISLGPTATVLAYDLAKEGYQAVDIGHIDIEYEWFLQGVEEKIPVKNKYIGEITGGEDVGVLHDTLYEKQIQKVII